MAGINTSQLEVGLVLHLMEHQDEEITVDDLVKQLTNTGLIRSFIEGLLWKLSREDRLVVPPMASDTVRMPASVQMHPAYRDAFREITREAQQRQTGILTVYLEHALASD